MKSKISFSRYSIILTIILSLVCYIGCFITLKEKAFFYLFLSLYLTLFILTLLYGTAYIKATSKYVVLGSILKSRKISIENIEHIELFQPTMGAVNVCASGGFMGYWGIFREGDVGRYYAFYGKSSDCFFIRMKNGDKYVLGCKNPELMVEYIKSQMK